MTPTSAPNGPNSGGFLQPENGKSFPKDASAPGSDLPKSAAAGHGAPRKRSSIFSRSSALRLLADTGLIIVGAVAVAVLLRMFVVQVYQIPSASMTDTLQVGSRIAVNRVPGIGTQVDRGDVVVFEDALGWLPNRSDEDRNVFVRAGEFLGIVPAGGEQVLVKRIIGVGGDTVECCSPSGNLMVNGTEVNEPYVLNGQPGSVPFEVQVPEGSLWVMGDNRSNSADSLYHHAQDGGGFISEDAIIGRAAWEVWPVSQWSYLGNRDVFKDVR